MIHQRHRQTDGQTDRQTTCDRKNALCTIVHRAVKTLRLLTYLLMDVAEVDNVGVIFSEFKLLIVYKANSNWANWKNLPKRAFKIRSFDSSRV